MTKALNLESIDDQAALTQKELGAYYTPENLTSILSKWAIRTPQDNIFEPSFGGCGFLQSAVNRLIELGSQQPTSHLWGCDIDQRAFEYLYSKLNAIENVNGRFLLKDFMETNPQDFDLQGFDVAIGNPPYISLHNLSDIQKKSVDAWLSRQAISISKRASLWAYFVLKSFEFLSLGGRMAWVLPGSLLFAEYGIQLQTILRNNFGRVWAIKLGERVFLTEGTEERTVVLLCEGYGQASNKIVISHSETLEDLAHAIQSLTFGEADVLPRDTPTAFSNLAERPETKLLGELASVLIGTVTGANKFFVLKPSEIRKLDLEKKYYRPILAKFAYAKGAALRQPDLDQWIADDARCFIFHVDNENEMSASARRYAATFDKDAKELNQTFKKRGDWLAADDGRNPDAFLSYMNHHGPKIVLNDANVNSTNSMHRIYFETEINDAKRKLIAISLLSTFSQLSAELVGRSYGSGVLKIEPSEAKKMKIHLPRRHTSTIERTFDNLDRCLRTNNLQAAQDIADNFIFSNEADKGLIAALRFELDTLRSQRRRD